MNDECEGCGKEFKAGEEKYNDFGFCVCKKCKEKPTEEKKSEVLKKVFGVVLISLLIVGVYILMRMVF